MRSTGFLAISLILHGIIICVLIALEKKSPNVPPTNDTIQSYLVLAPVQPLTQSTVSQQDIQESNEVDIEPQPEEPTKIVTESQHQKDTGSNQEEDTPHLHEQATPEVNTGETNVDITAQEDSIATPRGNVQTSTQQYFEQLNQQALNSIASSIRSTPVPIRSSPRHTSNEIQDRMGNTLRKFAPEGLNIEIVAEYGGNETTIKLGNKCYNVRQTSLDDKVHNGSSVWTLSSECGDTSGYAEQLEASLNKYLDR